MTASLLAAIGPVGRLVHEPAPRAGQRAHLAGTASRSPTPSSTDAARAGRRARAAPARPCRATSRSSPRAALNWFADIAVDVAVVEVGLGGTWDATNVVDGTVAVVTNVSIDHVEYLGPTRADIAAEKSGIVDPAPRWCSARPTRSCSPIFAAREPAGRAAARRATSRVAPHRLAHGGRLVDLVHARARATTRCSCRCTARTRPTTRRPRSTAAECFIGRPARRGRGRRRARARARRPAGSRSSATARSCCSTARTTSPARTHSSTRSPRSSRRGRARSWSGCSARRTRRDARGAGGHGRGADRVLPRRRARAPRSRRASPTAAIDLGVDRERVDVAELVSPTRSPARSP